MALSLVSIAVIFLFFFFFFLSVFKLVRVFSWPPWTPHVLVSRLEPQGYVCRRLPAITTSPDAKTHLHPLQPLLVSVAAPGSK